MQTQQNNRFGPRSLAAAAGAALALTAMAHAQTPHAWQNALGGSWGNANNWSPMTVPGPADDATIAIAGTYTVTVPNGTAQNASNLFLTNSNATLFLPDNLLLNLNGTTHTNNGTIFVSGPGQPGNNTRIQFNSPCTLSGTGQLTLRALGNGDNNTAYLELGAAADVLTNASTHTINGDGRIYTPINNQGLIDANVGGAVINLLSQPKSNSGTLRASNGGTLLLEVPITQTGGGALIAQNGSNIVLQSCSVSGGTLSTAGTGLIVNNNSQTSGIDSVALTSGSVLQINDNSNLTLGAGGLVNNGHVYIQNPGGAGNNTRLTAAAPTSITGTGTITLQALGNGDNNTAYLDYSAPASSVGFSSGQTVNGSGRIYLPMSNAGVIDASSSGQMLVLTDQPKANTGTMRATGGGQLRIRGTTVTQSGSGQIRADNAAVVLESCTVNGGPMSAVNGGTLVNTNSQTSTINAMTLSQGTLQLNDNSVLVVTNGLVNNGMVLVSTPGAPGNNTRILPSSASQTFSGSGTIRLQATGNFNNTAYLDYTSVGSPPAPTSVTNAAGHTIAGVGRIYTMLANNGVIVADVGTANQNVLNLLDQPKTNNNLMRATGGGQLWITGTSVTQAAGATIQVDTGSVGGLISSTISGGRLTSSGTGLFVNNNGQTSAIDSVILTSGTQLQLNDNSVLQVFTSLANNGTIFVDTSGAPGNNTHLDAASANVPLNGTGTIRLQATGNFNDSAYLAYTSGPNVFTSAAGQTVAGNGRIYTNFVNNGTILADSGVAGHEVLNLLQQPKINNSLMRATGGGQLWITGTSLTQSAAATVQVDTGSLCGLSSASVSGGRFTSAGTGLFVNTNGQTSTLDGVSLTAGTRLQLNDNSTVNIGPGGLANNGTFLIDTIGAPGNNTRMVAPGAAIISGSGALRLQAVGFNSDSSYIWGQGDAMHPLTIGSGQTITGTGRLYGNIVLQGTVSPDQPFGTPGTIGQVGAFGGMLAMAPTTVFNAEIGPASAADTIVGNDVITVDGTLNVTFVNGYTPLGGEVITLVSGSSVSGHFSTVHLPAVGSFGPAHIEYLSNAVVLVMCYANCDGSTSSPVLNVNDFVCFQARFAAGSSYANCDGSTTPPVLNVNDFVCFQNRFAAGCP